MKRLVVLAPNWLGDAVMALPAIADVRRAAPDASITVAARPAIAPLFALVPEVDDTIVLSKPAAIRDVARWRALGAELAGGGSTPRCCCPIRFTRRCCVSRAGIPERWGYRTDWRGAAADARGRAAVRLHQVAYYQHLVARARISERPGEPRVARAASRRATRRRALLTADGWDGQRAAGRARARRGVRRREALAAGVFRASSPRRSRPTASAA